MSPIELRVRDVRKAKGLTQERLARLAGIRRATLSQLESGRVQRVDFGTLEKVAKALGVSVLSLLREKKRP